MESNGSSRSSPNITEAERRRPTLPSQVICVLSSFPELLNLALSNDDQIIQSINQIVMKSLSDYESKLILTVVLIVVYQWKNNMPC